MRKLLNERKNTKKDLWIGNIMKRCGFLAEDEAKRKTAIYKTEEKIAGDQSEKRKTRVGVSADKSREKQGEEEERGELKDAELRQETWQIVERSIFFFFKSKKKKKRRLIRIAINNNQKILTGND